MKRIFLSFGLLLALSTTTIMFNSCDKGEDKPAIRLKNERDLTQMFFADEKEKNNGIEFTTTGAWTSTIKTPQQTRSSNATNWISISPDRGNQAGNYTITITLTVNTTGADRTALIVISSGDTERTITVTQRARTETGNVPTEPTEPENPTDPEEPVAPPCEDLLTMNQIRDVWIEHNQGQNYSVTRTSSRITPSDTYEIEVNTGERNPLITFTFSAKPTTGVYNTWTSVNRWDPNVNVAVHISKYINYGYEFPPRLVNSLLSVYVNSEDDDKITISFCDLEYSMYLNYRTYPYSITGMFEVTNNR